MPKIEVTKRFRFEAAHFLPDHHGPCARLHGHSYRLEVTVVGAVGPDGMVIDFDDLGRVVRDVCVDRFDHTLLNDTIDVPTAENIALTIWADLIPHLPNLAAVTVRETSNNRATVTP